MPRSVARTRRTRPRRVGRTRWRVAVDEQRNREHLGELFSPCPLRRCAAGVIPDTAITLLGHGDGERDELFDVSRECSRCERVFVERGESGVSRRSSAIPLAVDTLRA